MRCDGAQKQVAALWSVTLFVQNILYSSIIAETVSLRTCQTTPTLIDRLVRKTHRTIKRRTNPTRPNDHHGRPKFHETNACMGPGLPYYVYSHIYNIIRNVW